MFIAKEITVENHRQFQGLEARVVVWEHKQGEVRMRHPFHLFGIIVFKDEGVFVVFSQGFKEGPYSNFLEVLEQKSVLYKFFYIEIK